MTAARPEPAQRPDPRPAAGPDLRLSVWPTAQRDARTQRRGRYLPESTAHPAKMLPSIAATAIARYTEPGDLVADPMCGIGTTLVDAAHLAHQGLDELLAGFTAILSGCAVLLRPGGLAVVTARPWRQHGELVDLPAAVIAAGARAGLVPVARCVALLAGLRGGRLIARPSFFQLDNLRRARRQGQPCALIEHDDVLTSRTP